MNTYKLDYAADGSFDTVPGMGRSLLQVYTGTNISETEARTLLRKIADHKWYVSEKLSRDVGFHVAAIDYVENFYEPENTGRRQMGEVVSRAVETVRSVLKKYLVAKGNALPV